MSIARVFFFGLIIFLSSCAFLKRTDSDIAEKRAEIGRAERASNYYLAAGDFQKALDAYQDVYRRFGRDPHVQKGISGVVDAIGEKAEAAYRSEDFAASGRLWRILLRSGLLRASKGTPFFDAEAAAARLSDCSSMLTKKGLEYYRKGELKRAVGIWESALEFDPDNVEVKRAIETASNQLRNLQ